MAFQCFRKCSTFHFVVFQCIQNAPLFTLWCFGAFEISLGHRFANKLHEIFYKSREVDSLFFVSLPMHKTAKICTTSKQHNYSRLKKGVSVSETTTSNLMFQTICCNNLCWKKINIAGIVRIISLPGRHNSALAQH